MFGVGIGSPHWLLLIICYQILVYHDGRTSIYVTEGLQQLTTISIGFNPHSPSLSGIFCALPGYDYTWTGTGSRDVNNCSRLSKN